MTTHEVYRDLTNLETKAARMKAGCIVQIGKIKSMQEERKKSLPEAAETEWVARDKFCDFLLIFTDQVCQHGGSEVLFELLDHERKLYENAKVEIDCINSADESSYNDLRKLRLELKQLEAMGI